MCAKIAKNRVLFSFLCGHTASQFIANECPKRDTREKLEAPTDPSVTKLLSTNTTSTGR